MTVLIPRAGASRNQATDLSLRLQRGSPQKKAPGDRELQGTLINPNPMSLPQARAPNCTAEPRAGQSPQAAQPRDSKCSVLCREGGIPG